MALLQRIDLAASESNFQTSLRIVHRGTGTGGEHRDREALSYPDWTGNLHVQDEEDGDN